MNWITIKGRRERGRERERDGGGGVKVERRICDEYMEGCCYESSRYLLF